jgi:hypothetical protein
LIKFYSACSAIEAMSETLRAMAGDVRRLADKDSSSGT